MFIGHLAIGFASKRFAPQTSLGVLTAAALLPDLLWPVFLLLGWEKVRIAPGDTAFTPLAFVSCPISHSLLAVSGLAAAFALFYQAYTRYQPGAIAIFAGVLSHWFLDAATHRPDLPLYPGGPLIGLGLWNFSASTMFVEILIFSAGIYIYTLMTVPRNRVGTHSLWIFIVFLLAL